MENSLPTFVFVGGAAVNPDSWRDVVRGIQGKAKISVFDMRDLDSIDKMADRIIMNTPGKFALCGESVMGGAVALGIAERVPGRLTSLVLINATANSAQDEEIAERFAAMNTSRQDFDAGIHQRFADTLSPASRHNEDVLNRVRHMHAGADRDSFALNEYAVIRRKDAGATLSKLQMPVYIINGADDPVVPPEQQPRLPLGSSRASVKNLPGCGHRALAENPFEVLRVLQDCVLAVRRDMQPQQQQNQQQPQSAPKRVGLSLGSKLPR